MADKATSSYPGACDCHVHIYDDRFAQVPNLAVIPPRAPVSAYRDVQRRLGLERVVIVQPAAYGFDNSCTLDAVAQLGKSARGICLVQPDVADSVISGLHDGGMRGVRYMMIGGPLRWDSLEPMAARLAGFGWMINLQLDGRTLPEHEEVLKRLPCTLVIDHNGKFLEPVAPEHPSFQSLLRVLDTGRAWIKLSAPYETSKSGPPAYEDVSLLARTLARKFPERCLWASNWPHPGRNPAPPDEALYGLLPSWADTDSLRQRILVENPQQLYGFSS
jgi:D-galactarolactone isomerase